MEMPGEALSVTQVFNKPSQTFLQCPQHSSSLWEALASDSQYFVLFAVSYVSFSKAGKAHHVANSDYHFIFLILEGKATLIPNINVQIRWRWKYSLD